MKQILLLLFFITVLSSTAFAHCDTLQGPVVKAAKQSIEKKNPETALIWVAPGQESEAKTSFQKTMYVRQLNPEAKELADKTFVETMVRLHRIGEGMPFTGLKSEEPRPEIIMADGAVETDSVQELVDFFKEKIDTGLKVQFKKVKDLKNFASDDVESGREYTKAYFEFTHYVERLQNSISLPLKHHPAGLQEELVVEEKEAKLDVSAQETSDNGLKSQLSFAWALVATLAIIIIVLAIAYAMPKSRKK